MKVFGQRKRAAAAVLAAGTLMALAACTPASPGTASAAPRRPRPAPSAAQPSTTAPASPSAEPGTSATVGALVPGFPQELLPVMPGAKVVSSSFDKTTVPGHRGTRRQHLRRRRPTCSPSTPRTLEAQGFKAVPGETVGAVPSKDFLRGDNETVNISVLETAGVSTFTIGANVAAESVK